jgi:alkaline phosphatase D
VHGWERWGHLPAEQARLFDLLGRTKARGVIVVSGDRHRSAIYKRTVGLSYPLYDVTSSALNRSQAGVEPEDAGRLGPMLAENNFGLVAIDWEQRRLRLSLHPLSGREWAGVEIAFRELGLPD